MLRLMQVTGVQSSSLRTSVGSSKPPKPCNAEAPHSKYMKGFKTPLALRPAPHYIPSSLWGPKCHLPRRQHSAFSEKPHTQDRIKSSYKACLRALTAAALHPHQPKAAPAPHLPVISKELLSAKPESPAKHKDGSECGIYQLAPLSKAKAA